VLVIFRGLPGTGKSFLVRRLVNARPEYLVLSRDILRAGIIPRPSYSETEKTLIDDLIVESAAFLLRRSQDVVIDGMALSSARRIELFARAAESSGSPIRIIECVCSERTALERIAHDVEAHPAGDRDSALYFAVKGRFEPIPRSFLRIDTDEDAEANLRAILAYINADG
jgi:predicted kinase